MMIPAWEIGWEALHLSAHKRSLCNSQRTDYHSEHSTSGQKWSRVGGWPRGGILWQQPSSQSGLTRTEPCVASKSPWKRLEHLAGLSTAACRHQGVFSCGGAGGCAEANPPRCSLGAAPGPASLPFPAFLHERGARSSVSPVMGGAEESSFICWTWICWRASLVSQAITCYRSQGACFGTPELFRRSHFRKATQNAPRLRGGK